MMARGNKLGARRFLRLWERSVNAMPELMSVLDGLHQFFLLPPAFPLLRKTPPPNRTFPHQLPHLLSSMRCRSCKIQAIVIKTGEFISGAQTGESQHSVRHHNASNMLRQVSELHPTFRHLYSEDDVL